MSVAEAARRIAPTDHRAWLAEVATDLATSPLLADHAAVPLGPSFTERGRRGGVHRRTGAGERLAVDALVLERT